MTVSLKRITNSRDEVVGYKWFGCLNGDRVYWVTLVVRRERDLGPGWWVRRDWREGELVFPNSFKSLNAVAEAITEIATEPVYSRRKRDSQRSRVYKSEGVMPTGDLGDYTQESYVRMVERSSLWESLCGLTKPITVNLTPGRRASSATYRTHTITFSSGPFHESRETVLHEMAHLASYRFYGKEDGCGHGAEFTGVLLALLDEFMPGHGANLRAEFARNRVKVREVEMVQTAYVKAAAKVG